MPNKSSIYCVLYRLCCSNCGSIYSGKSLQIQLKLCHLIIYCSLKKLLADFGMKLGYCDLWTTSYIHWKAAHSLNSFPNRHIICDACCEKSHCNHRICGFVFILCHFACLPSQPPISVKYTYAMEHNPGSQFHIEYAPLIWIYSNGHCEWNSFQTEYACWLY